MNITKINIVNNWEKLENLIALTSEGFKFDSETSYVIQNCGTNPLLVCEQNTLPEENAGFVKFANDVPFIYKKGQYDLWIKASGYETTINIGDNK